MATFDKNIYQKRNCHTEKQLPSKLKTDNSLVEKQNNTPQRNIENYLADKNIYLQFLQKWKTKKDNKT